MMQRTPRSRTVPGHDAQNSHNAPDTQPSPATKLLPTAPDPLAGLSMGAERQTTHNGEGQRSDPRPTSPLMTGLDLGIKMGAGLAVATAFATSFQNPGSRFYYPTSPLEAAVAVFLFSVVVGGIVGLRSSRQESR
jgi:hypothetical protein